MSSFSSNLKVGGKFGQKFDTVPDKLGPARLKNKGDNFAQAYFIGQITGGTNFTTEEGIFCEMVLDVGPKWTLINGAQQRNESDANDFKSITTQTAYADPGQVFVWSHPVDLEFKVSSLNGWPKGILKVWQLDDTNKIDILSYGIINFPRNEGYHKVEVQTWAPRGDWKQANSTFYLGNQPRLNSLDLVKYDENRSSLLGVSNGTVIFEFEVRKISIL